MLRLRHDLDKLFHRDFFNVALVDFILVRKFWSDHFSGPCSDLHHNVAHSYIRVMKDVKMLCGVKLRVWLKHKA